jgi:hypothetical protein
MQVCRTDIGVVLVRMSDIVLMVMMMMMIVVEQQPCAEKIYCETNHRHNGRVAELDWHRCEEPRHGLVHSIRLWLVVAGVPDLLGTRRNTVACRTRQKICDRSVNLRRGRP